MGGKCGYPINGWMKFTGVLSGKSEYFFEEEWSLTEPCFNSPALGAVLTNNLNLWV